MSIRTPWIPIASLALGAALAFPAAGLQAEPAIPSYDVQAVGGTVGWSINENGDVGGWTSVDGITRGFIHSPAIGTRVLPSPVMRPFAIVRDVSDRNAEGVIEVVGSAYTDILDEPGHAVRWRVDTDSGAIEGPLDLGVLANQRTSQARGVNNAGTITGYSGNGAFLYTDAAGMQQIEDLAGLPQDINESGVVAGYGGLRAFRWSEAGGTEDLGVPPGFAFSFGLALNDSGQVAGYGRTSGGIIFEQIARYSDGAGWELLGGIGSDNEGWGINNHGSVVGHGVTASDRVTGRRAVIYTDALGRLTYLDDLLSPAARAAGWGVLRAYDINDAGQVVGWGTNGFDGGALLLTPAGEVAVPAAPSDLNATPRPPTSQYPTAAILLAWTDNSDDEQAFVVERRGPDDAAFRELTRLGAGTTAYIDTDLVACETYEYRVQAVNLAGASGYSNEAWAEAPCEAVDRTPPEVEILAPADGDEVSGRVTIRARATDDTGVVHMRVVEDGRELCTSSDDSIECRWNTRREATGTHTLVVWAYDAMTNIGQQTIRVEVVPRSRDSGNRGRGGGGGRWSFWSFWTRWW